MRPEQLASRPVSVAAGAAGPATQFGEIRYIVGLAHDRDVLAESSPLGPISLGPPPDPCGAAMSEKPNFLFTTCQIGAETALKAEIARAWPNFHFSFSRPGFLTFKLPEGHGLVADFDLGSTFARAYGFSLGRATGNTLDDLAAQAWQIYGTRPVRGLHVWQRDLAPAGLHGYEPQLTSTALAARSAIEAACPNEEVRARLRSPVDLAVDGDFVLDCVLVEPDQWWVGYHRAKGPCTRAAGGMIALSPPETPVSRAWYKLEEGLAWSELPVPDAARFADLGCAPGGISQALLQRGHWVLGVDPAEIDGAVLEHPRFEHVRRRTPQVKRRDFRKIRWLTADMNVAPQYTLEAVESIVTHREVRVRGLLLTLKLLKWNLAERIPEYVDQVRSWGFNHVWTRQLTCNRQEICLAALKKPFT